MRSILGRLRRNILAMRAQLNHTQQELIRSSQTLEERVEQRTQELDALYEVSREISSRLDFNLVLNSVTEKARWLLQAETAFLCLLDKDSQFLRLQAFSGPDKTVRQVDANAENPFVRTILSDTCARPCKASGCLGNCGIMEDAYRASHLASPLWAGERVIGALCVGSRQANAFSAEAPALLTRLANVAAVALENARLYAQVERIATLEERQRIAAAMHDGQAQMIDTLGLLVDQAIDQLETGSTEQAERTLNRARESITQASAEVRRSIASLQDEQPAPKNIQERLKDLLWKFSHDDDGSVEWHAELEGSLFLVEEDVQQVIGIVHEALSNARRYSGASRISLRLAYSDREASLTVEDNGSGFDPLTPPADGRKHFGLKILEARATHLAGQLKLLSAPGEGTCITLTWPVRRMSIALKKNGE